MAGCEPTGLARARCLAIVSFGNRERQLFDGRWHEYLKQLIRLYLFEKSFG
jgi:hypothetical protein